jgi:hypothetical protein
MKRQRPLTIALVSCALLVIGGIVGIVLGYTMMARTLYVPDQIPALVSGGLGGIGLIIAGCVFGYVQVGRACSERERSQEEQLLSRIGTLADLERRRIAAGDDQAPKQRTRRTPVKKAGS